MKISSSFESPNTKNLSNYHLHLNYVSLHDTCLVGTVENILNFEDALESVQGSSLNHC